MHVGEITVLIQLKRRQFSKGTGIQTSTVFVSILQSFRIFINCNTMITR